MGTIWCVYLFFLLSILPLIEPSWTNVIMYISSTIIQLVALPAIMVGQQLLGQRGEDRAQQDHETIMAQFEETKELHNHIDEILSDVASDAKEIKALNILINEIIYDDLIGSKEIKAMHEKINNIVIDLQNNFEILQSDITKIEEKLKNK
jgi:uncharacterized membrane protein